MAVVVVAVVPAPVAALAAVAVPDAVVPDTAPAAVVCALPVDAAAFNSSVCYTLHPVHYST